MNTVNADRFPTNRFAMQLVQFAVLSLLSVFVACLLESFGSFVDITLDEVELRLGTQFLALPLVQCIVGLGILAVLLLATLSYARRRTGESLDKNPVGKLGVGILLILICVLLRLVGESRGLLPTDFAPKSLLPKFDGIGIAFLSMLAALFLVVLLMRVCYCNAVRRLWQVAAPTTLVLGIGTLGIRFESHEILIVLSIAGCGYVILQLLQNHSSHVLAALLGDPSHRPAWMSYSQLCVATGIMSVLTAHAVVGFFYSIPAWKMFRRIERWTYELTDVHGEQIDIRTHVPERAYTITSSTSVQVVGEWIGEKQPDRLPLLAVIRSGKVRGNETQWTDDSFMMARPEGSDEVFIFPADGAAAGRMPKDTPLEDDASAQHSNPGDIEPRNNAKVD